MSDVIERAIHWISQDPSEGDRQELRRILDLANAGDANAIEQLNAAFSGSPEFGTAGLRGKMIPGESGMNLHNVMKAAYGVGKFCASKVKNPRVAIGFDARHHSFEFAEMSAKILTALGCEVELMPKLLPTPVLAFAVRKHDFDCGIMVTASHNPKDDNGYKVYLGGRIVRDEGQGSQIVSPFDALISDEIAASPQPLDMPIAESGWVIMDEAIEREYNDVALELVGGDQNLQSRNDLRVVVTAMHGVGGPIVVEQLKNLGILDVHIVKQQFEPDPDFPSIPFPNPEEAGALDMAIALAEDVKADLVIAVDPDADRCSCAGFDPHLKKYRQLNGDEIGSILGDYFCKRYAGTDRTVASSIVSSRLLAKIAKSNGLQKIDTLTGFKWISRAKNMIFGYEEAIGFCVTPKYVHDKDGPTAASLLCAIARKNSIFSILDDLAVQHGLHTSGQQSIRMGSIEKIEAFVEKFRSNPPSEIAGSSVESVIDYSIDPPEPQLQTNAVAIHLADQTRIIIRPSGTEPKVKCYIELISPVPSLSSIGTLRSSELTKLDQIKSFLAS